MEGMEATGVEGPVDGDRDGRRECPQCVVGGLWGSSSLLIADGQQLSLVGCDLTNNRLRLRAVGHTFLAERPLLNEERAAGAVDFHPEVTQQGAGSGLHEKPI